MASPSSGQALTVLLIIGMLVFGSYNTVNVKFQDQICAPTLDRAVAIRDGCPPGHKHWAKPWLQNILMFIGEATLLGLHGATRQRSGDVPVDRGLLVEHAPGKTPFYVFAVPAFCDVFGTGLASVSMLYLDSTIWQMLRSSIIVFSAFVSVVFLKRRLQPFHWLAVLVVFAGLVVVCLGNSLDADAQSGAVVVTPAQSLVGVGLVIFAQVCAAFQMCFEEMLLTSRAPTSASRVVGCEGVWGVVFMTVVLIIMNQAPGDDAGRFEYFADGVYMLANQQTLLYLVTTYMISIAVYNAIGIIVGKRMSAVVRCLVDSCRTVVVWIVNLALYYGVSDKYGAGWKPHSWMTFVGFLILVFGTLLYNEVLPVHACLRSRQETTAGATAVAEQPGNEQARQPGGALAKAEFAEGRCSAREVAA